MSRFIMLAALALVATACGIGGPTGAGWRDANLRAVDGIWITGEEPCGPTSADGRCGAARAVALEQVTVPGNPVPIGLSIARLPREWVNDKGERILTTTSGISKPVVAIVDLADGRRVAVGLVCDPVIDGNPARPANCFSVPSILDPYRVGRSSFWPGGDAP